MSERPTIVIATPSTDSVKAGFALDLAMLYGLVCAEGSLHCAIVQNKGTIIPQQRATLVTKAMEFGASHMLWLDSDMRFPKDTLFRLLAHEQPIVAANYARRRTPILPTAEFRDRGFLFTTDDAAGLAEVTQCGFGVMLVAMSVFETIPEPWFQIGYTPSDHQYVGEDFFFCRKAREAGYKILIDQDLSREVRHVGDMEFTNAHTVVTRDTYNAREQAGQNGHAMLEIVRGA